MFRYFRETFLEPRGTTWFRQGLLIESASAPVAQAALSRLRSALPGISFNLLSRTERPGLGFRDTFRVKRPLGGLRLLWRARKHYDLVVFFATGERELRLCRAFALLVMRPRRFFVFNEFGEGFWLHRATRRLIWRHLERRYDLESRWRRVTSRWRAFVSTLDKAARACVSAVRTALVWLPRQSVRLAYLLNSALLFSAALLMLAVLRLTYDSRHFRFRFFRKTASAPRRELEPSVERAIVLKTPQKFMNPTPRQPAPPVPH